MSSAPSNSERNTFFIIIALLAPRTVPGDAIRPYYTFFCRCAIVFVMDARTETVIIPHPNEQNRIAELQRQI
ncbi:MAG: hypothetical protein K2J14_06360, partial [Treponemataceae bacterium]|nr:hypothetical protein [Treponemataceae bacterium]